MSRDVNTWQNKIIRHFKGGHYQFLYVAKHTEGYGDMAIYRALDGTEQIYARPLHMFMEMCNPAQYAKFGQVYRFELME